MYIILLDIKALANEKKTLKLDIGHGIEKSIHSIQKEVG